MGSVLRHATFRRLLIAHFAALLATGLLTVALGLLAYDLAGGDAGAVLGTALAIKMVAYVFVAPLASALTYRMRRRTVMIGADAVRGIMALALTVVDQTWQIYVLVFALQAASATFTPAFQSVIPAVLVDEDDYTRGLSLSRLAYDLESLVSPLLAAALITVISYSGLFVATVTGFAASAALVACSALPDPAAARATESVWRRSTAGVVRMWNHPVLRALLSLNLAVAAATGLVLVNSVVYVREVLNASAPMLAGLLACFGGGSAVVALLVPGLLRRTADRRLMLAAAATIPVVLGATAALLATATRPDWAAVGLLTAWSALGAATSMINTPAARLLRHHGTRGQLPQLFSAQFSLSHACFFVTYLLAGWLGATLGQSAAAAVLAAVAAVGALTAGRGWPRGVAASVEPPAVAASGR